ncbi:heavy metal translocating P-type ATPase [Streptomyces sp. NPDC097619]|uniref:heavy metal translocating P-type ATPase n=1 Tax=Streptomyces sp. NPDC097619 TaxID=3157228 RepID=UPI0033187415
MSTNTHRHGFLGERAELISALLALTVWIAGLALGLTPLFMAAYLFGGFFTLREALGSVRKGVFHVDFLMLVAAAGAAAIGRWEEGAVLLVLFSLGHALEGYALGRARRSIESLGALAPRTALRLTGTATAEVPVEELVPGDRVAVRPHTRVPADGFLVAGTGSVDQSPITGESVPADKRPVPDPAAALALPGAVPADSRLFAGTVNGAGALELVVTRRAADNTLSRVVRMVREAEDRKSPTQRFTDRFQKVFVPGVLALVLALSAYGWFTGEPFSDSFYRAMAVLVAASPCALAIATPAAVLSAVGRAARGGVLVKGGAPLEEFGRLRTVAFDKTGTLTEGRPRLTDVLPAEGADRAELLRTALAVQRYSDHPLAQAVVRDAPAHLAGSDTDGPTGAGGGVGVEGRVGASGGVAGGVGLANGDGGRGGDVDRRIPEAVDVRAVIGQGVAGRIGDTEVRIGSLAGFDEAGTPVPAALRAQAEELAAAGRTTMAVRHGDRHLGVLGLMDTPRAEAAATVARLRELGVTRTVMLSGDDQRVADSVAAQVGIDEARGGLLPEDKAGAIKDLRAGGRTAMIGDGVNDAPALAGATVGVAMGAAGSAVALETADIALMSDDLDRLPFITGLSRRATRVIRQNLWLSLGIVAVLVPATVLGMGIGPAVLVHEGSTLLVVGNALRLLRHPDPR